MLNKMAHKLRKETESLSYSFYLEKNYIKLFWARVHWNARHEDWDFSEEAIDYDGYDYLPTIVPLRHPKERK